MLANNGTLFSLMGFENAGDFCMLNADTHLTPDDAALGIRMAACHMLDITVAQLFRYA